MSEFVKRFHTATTQDLCKRCVEEIFPWNKEVYQDWVNAGANNRNIRYLSFELFSRIEEDGSLTRTPDAPAYYPGTFDELIYRQKIIRDEGFISIVDAVIENFETIPENGLRQFLQNWSIELGANWVIWCPIKEYNQYEPWGSPEWGGRCWRVDPADYDRVMALIRSVRDELGITNILIGSHAWVYRGDWWDPNYSGWIAGMRHADILGGSSYNNDVDNAWTQAKLLYERIGQLEKPFFFFEYSTQAWEEPHPPVKADYVNRSYAKILDYSFVKNITWYFWKYYEPGALESISGNASRYEGYTPISPLRWLIPIGIGAFLLSIGEKSKRRG